jgi:SAM-dependent methyltransferase
VAHYDAAYGNFAERVQGEVRRKTFGEDIGQTGWTTGDEWRRFLGWLELSPASHLLDVASGSGGPALLAARETGCRVTGIDIHEKGVANGNRLAAERGLAERARFQLADASRTLPFSDATLDALTCIDAFNHLRDRPRVVSEFHRVLKPGGRLLITDPITVTGIVTSEEIFVRSAAGFYLWAPEGADDRLLAAAGFEIVRRDDTTDSVSRIAERWHAARAEHEDELRRLEGADTYEGQQKLFELCHRLASERRLSRFVFLARRR